MSLIIFANRRVGIQLSIVSKYNFVENQNILIFYRIKLLLLEIRSQLKASELL